LEEAFPGMQDVLFDKKGKGLRPIGMLEFWNIGIMGSGIMEWWV